MAAAKPRPTAPRHARARAMVLLFGAFAAAALMNPMRAGAQVPDQCDAYCEPQRTWWPFHCACLHPRPPWNMKGYGWQAASAVVQGFHAQDQNGEAIEATLWNHHFEEGGVGESGEKLKPTAKLHPSALAMLHRAARRHAHEPGFVILVQTAHDIEFTPDQLDGYANDVDQLDTQRVAAVRDYLAKVLRRPDARVLVHDPPVVGMASGEMKAAYENMVRYGPRSVLEVFDPEIRPLGAYLAPPGYVYGPRGLEPIPAVLGGQR